MRYNRVIPRDLFNEANLLKCYGQIYLNLERMKVNARLVEKRTDKGFDIAQDQGDGSLSITNIRLVVNGNPVSLRRPINSRQPFPLWIDLEDGTEIEVFKENGDFSEEMKLFLEAGERN